MNLASASMHVIVADIFRYPCMGISEMLRRKSSIKTLMAININEVFAYIMKYNIPWSILTDEFLSQFGIDRITGILKKHPRHKIAILTSVQNINHLHHLASLGVKAIIHKSTLGRELKEAILNHSTGDTYLCPVISKIYYSALKNPAAYKKILSDRQAEIIIPLIGRKSRKEIAGHLQIRITTVHTQCARIYEKQRRYQFTSLLHMARADGIII